MPVAGDTLADVFDNDKEFTICISAPGEPSGTAAQKCTLLRVGSIKSGLGENNPEGALDQQTRHQFF